jgi:hypothetical protein
MPRKRRGGVKVQLHAFLTYREVNVLLLISTALSPRQLRGTNCIGSLLCPTVDHEFLLLSNLISFVQYTDLARHYTDGAIPAHM